MPRTNTKPAPDSKTYLAAPRDPWTAFWYLLRQRAFRAYSIEDGNWTADIAPARLDLLLTSSLHATEPDARATVHVKAPESFGEQALRLSFDFPCWDNPDPQHWYVARELESAAWYLRNHPQELIENATAALVAHSAYLARGGHALWRVKNLAPHSTMPEQLIRHYNSLAAAQMAYLFEHGASIVDHTRIRYNAVIGAPTWDFTPTGRFEHHDRPLDQYVVELAEHGTLA